MPKEALRQPDEALHFVGAVHAVRGTRCPFEQTRQAWQREPLPEHLTYGQHPHDPR